MDKRTDQPKGHDMNTDLNSHPIVAELWRRLYQWADEAERARTAR